MKNKYLWVTFLVGILVWILFFYSYSQFRAETSLKEFVYGGVITVALFLFFAFFARAVYRFETRSNGLFIIGASVVMMAIYSYVVLANGLDEFLYVVYGLFGLPLLPQIMGLVGISYGARKYRRSKQNL